MTKIGTLAELNVKPGDVVEYVPTGDHHTVLDGKRLTISNGGTVDYEYSWGYVKSFRIVSRASDNPKLWRDMTPEEKGALLLAHHEGKVIENKGPYNDWMEAEPCWQSDYAYRIKPERTKSDWSAWFVSKQDGTTKLDLDTCADVERVALGDSKQFAYRVKKWVE